MPYYAGDYYEGDYYNYSTGDPLFGGLVAAGARLAGRAVTGLLGKPVSKAAIGTAVVPFVPKAVTPIVAQVPRIVKAGALPALGGAAIGAGIAGILGAGAEKKKRHMNVLNPRALRRATRRLCGFRVKSTAALRELGYTVKRTGVARLSAKCVKCGKKRCSC